MDNVTDLALPLANPEKTQTNVRMFISVMAQQPGVGAQDSDVEFLAQLTDKRLKGGLAGFDFAAGKLPETGIKGSRRTLTQQKAAVGPFNDGRGNVCDFHLTGFAVLEGMRPE